MFSSRTNWSLAPNRFSQSLERRRREGREIFDLTNSNPTTCGFHYPESEILAALAEAGSLRYEPESKGLRSAREAIAGYYRAQAGFDGAARGVNPERIVLTSGTSEAYSHIFRLLCDPADEILVPAPSYPLFEFLADLADIRLVSYPLFYDHGWFVDFKALEQAITRRSRAVIVVHPNNPTGSFIQEQGARQLNTLCASNEMALVADEVFLDYSDGDPRPSFASNRAVLTFTLSGLSKIALLPQMKLAWMTVSGPERSAVPAVDRLDVIADTFLSPGIPVQRALPAILNLAGGLQRQMRGRVQTNLGHLDNALRPGCVTRLGREGGWYAILRVPSTTSDEEIAIRLLEERGVLVHPGHFYNFPSEGFLVISLIVPEAEFQRGVQLLREFFPA